VLAALTAALITAPPLARAQLPCNAEAFVYDTEGNPLPDVEVVMEYLGDKVQKYRAKTDEKGKFTHLNIYTGRYDLTFRIEGHPEVTVKGFPFRELQFGEKVPTFRIGAQKPAPPEESAEAEPEGPTPEETAAVLAGELERGNAALADGKVDEAVGIYEALAAQAPAVPEVQHNLGLAYKRKGDLEAAEAAFRKATELDPDFAEPHGALAVMLAQAGKRDEAIVEEEIAVELDPESTLYLYNLAVLYKDSGRPAEAEQAFLALEELDPDNAEIQYHLGTTLLGLGRVDEAIAYLEKYIAIAPEDAANVPSAKAMIDALKKQQ
jgi:tetratricopeptide (TPR) repeat protein